MSSLFGDAKKKGAPSLTESIFGSFTSTGSSDLFANPTPSRCSNLNVNHRHAKRLRTTNANTTADGNDDKPQSKQAERKETVQKRRHQSQDKILDQLTISLKDYNIDDNNNNRDELYADVRSLMKHHGFVILRDALSVDDTTKITGLAEDTQHRICKTLDAKDIPYDSKVNDTEPIRFQELAVRCKGRMDVRYNDKSCDAGEGLGKDEANNTKKQKQKQLPNLSLIDDLAASVLHGAEPPNLVYAGWIFSFPGSADQPWHQDGSPLFETGTETLPSYALNVFCGLHHYDNDNDHKYDDDDDDDEGNNNEDENALALELGPTEFVVGSHHMTPDAAMEKVPNTTVSAVLGKGDILLYDYRICHRGTSNLSTGNENDDDESSDGDSDDEEDDDKEDGNDRGIVRKVLYLMYARPWFREHLNFGEKSLFE